MAEVKRFIMNGLDSNCYVVSDESSCYIIDIGGTDIESVKNYIEDSGKELRGVFLTHGHIDHIEGLNLICDVFKGVTVYIGKEDEKFLTDNNLNLAVYFPGKNFNFKFNSNVKSVKEGDIIDEKFEIIETPGHTAGCITIAYKAENALFTGDTMFRGTMGRTDLPTGNYSEMWKSLKKLTQLDEKFVVYPGHGEETDIKSEKESLFGENNY